jgi:hypothetical protein
MSPVTSEVITRDEMVEGTGGPEKKCSWGWTSGIHAERGLCDWTGDQGVVRWGRLEKEEITGTGKFLEMEQRKNRK